MDKDSVIQRGKVTCPELVNDKVNLKSGCQTLTLISTGALKSGLLPFFKFLTFFSPHFKSNRVAYKSLKTMSNNSQCGTIQRQSKTR